MAIDGMESSAMEDDLFFNFGKAGININPQRLSAVGYGESRPLVPTVHRPGAPGTDGWKSSG